MKTHRLLFLLCLAGVGCLQAQTTISLTFTAAYNGIHQTLDSIAITNLTQGGDTTLYGTDTLLVLDHGIGIEDRIPDHAIRMILYPPFPNPVNHTSTIRLWLPQDGPVNLRLFDLPGRELTTYSRSLGAGEHSFTFTPGMETFYLLVVEAADQRQVQKLINLNPVEGICRLFYIGQQHSTSAMRKGKSAFPWVPGDDLRFVGYAASDADTIADNPVTSSLYTFQFGKVASPTYPPGFVHCDPSNPTAIVNVTNSTTGRTWMDRNLGAAQVATSSTDTASYGDLYQWGRFADGHQCRTSATTTSLSSSDQPGHGNFIIGMGSPWDWRSPQNTNLWQGVNGENNPCPSGYRLPTEAEINAERQSWGTNNAAGAFASPLKLPMAGYRGGSNGSLDYVGSYGGYWSVTVSGTNSRFLSFGSANANLNYDRRAYGYSVRCIRDSIGNTASLPSLTTDTVTSITLTSAITGGNVTYDGGAVVTARGVCWSTSPNPTITNNTTNNGTGTGSFTSSLTGLTQSTTYYVRAYATNSAGTGYGNEVNFTTGSITGGPCPGMPTITDYNGNIYNTVQIGTQCWMKENLRVRNYRNGTAIPNITSNSTWTGLSTGARCWYNNDSATYAVTYGALYNWYAVDNTNGLCPTGWHVPTDAEWTILTDFLGGLSVAGGLLKDTGTAHWYSPNTGATNSTGFTALPGGARDYFSGTFFPIGTNGLWWSSSAFSATYAWNRSLNHIDGIVYRNYDDKKHGFSVRCIFSHASYPPGTVHCTPSNPTAVVDVTNPTTGRIWMDRNLGASQVATSSTDTASYGDLYQWGRFADGHQCRTSATTTSLSSSDQPGHGNFIIGMGSPYDWRSPQNTNLWQGVNGVNNPCPTGYRLPTEVELNAERLSWSSNNSAGAFASPLKLPLAGYRYDGNGSLYSVGSYGLYWSSTVSGTYSRYLRFYSASAAMLNVDRARGYSVRCLKD